MKRVLDAVADPDSPFLPHVKRSWVTVTSQSEESRGVL